MRITLHLIKDDPHALDMAMLALERAREVWQHGWEPKCVVAFGGLTFVVTKTISSFSVKQIEK